MTEDSRRVVFVSQRYPPEQGGNASRIRDTAINLQDAGWDVTVLSPVKSYPFDAFDRSTSWHTVEADDEITVHRFWTWQPSTTDPGMLHRLAYYLIFAFHAIWWLLRNVRRYDVVVTSSPPITTELAGLAASAVRKPWVADIRDLWINAAVSLGHISEGGLPERAARGFQRYALRSADRVTVTTEATVETLEETYGPGIEDKTVLIPNGVDVDEFRPVDGEEEPIVIYTGNLGAAQDLETCIAAMAHLSNDDATLRLVGSGDLEDELERLVEEHSLADRVEFTGLVPRSEVPGLLNEAMVGIAPLKDTDALEYAMPTKVYEYMACGLPTLVTGGEHIEWFVDESGGGVHVENDARRIAEELDALLADEAYRERLAERGYEHVRDRYTRDGIARRLSDELAQLVDGTDGRASGRVDANAGATADAKASQRAKQQS